MGWNMGVTLLSSSVWGLPLALQHQLLKRVATRLLTSKTLCRGNGAVDKDLPVIRMMGNGDAFIVAEEVNGMLARFGSASKRMHADFLFPCAAHAVASVYFLKLIVRIEDFQDCLYAWGSPNCLFKDGRSNVVLSSKECKIREEAGVHFLDLSLPNCSFSLCLGKTPVRGFLSQVEATFEDDTITLKLILADMVEDDAEDWEGSED